MSERTRWRSIGFFGLAVGVALGLFVGYAVSTIGAEQNLVVPSASSTGRLQVVSAQRINIEPHPINVVVMQDVHTDRSYLVVVGGQVIPLDDVAGPRERR